MKLQEGQYYLAKSGQIIGPIVQDSKTGVFYDPFTQLGFWEDGTCWGDSLSTLVRKIKDLIVEPLSS